MREDERFLEILKSGGLRGAALLADGVGPAERALDGRLILPLPAAGCALVLNEDGICSISSQSKSLSFWRAPGEDPLPTLDVHEDHLMRSYHTEDLSALERAGEEGRMEAARRVLGHVCAGDLELFRFGGRSLLEQGARDILVLACADSGEARNLHLKMEFAVPGRRGRLHAYTHGVLGRTGLWAASALFDAVRPRGGSIVRYRRWSWYRPIEIEVETSSAASAHEVLEARMRLSELAAGCGRLRSLKTALESLLSGGTNA